MHIISVHRPIAANASPELKSHLSKFFAESMYRSFAFHPSVMSCCTPLTPLLAALGVPSLADREGNVTVLDHVLDLLAHCAQLATPAVA